MLARFALTLQTQLVLPLIPFLVDTIFRVLLLAGHVPWFQVPDLVTLLATYAFYCLGVMANVATPRLRTDDDVKTNTELARQRLLGIAVASICIAVAISVVRAFNELIPDAKILLRTGPWLVAIVLLFVFTTFWRICSTYQSYVAR